MDFQDHFVQGFAVGGVFCLAFGSICSIQSVWDKIITKKEVTYLKAGEYGETEFVSSWSIFKEPFNAWTSLAYSLFGFVMIYVGFADLKSKSEGEVPQNRIAEYPEFSLMYGCASIALGIASFLFHASHAETWRKADAGMTSGVVVPLVGFTIWDHSRLPDSDTNIMIVAILIVLASFTYGYLPYGSSDILLPSLVAFVWILELCPRYGGVVDNVQYIYWLQSFCAVGGGALLRAIDIKRKSASTKQTLCAVYFTIILGFGYWIGYDNYVIIIALISGLFVVKYPERGHIFWHFASAFALYIWWHMLRVRPGNTPLYTNIDNNYITLIICVGIKNAIRRNFMSLSSPSILFGNVEQKDKIRKILEHSIMAYWAYYAIIQVPSKIDPNTSWFNNISLAYTWPNIPSDAFLFYFLGQMGFYIEEFLYYHITNYYANNNNSSSTNNSTVSHAVSDPSLPTTVTPSKLTKNKEKSVLMTFHLHFATVLVILAYLTGYAKLASVVLYVYDLSAVPFYCFRFCALKSWKQLSGFPLLLTIATWFYYRVYFFIFVIINSALFHTKSMMYETVQCAKESQCTIFELPEKIPVLLSLLTLLGMQVYWLMGLLKRGYQEHCSRY